jgi:hypothetical protein
MQVNVAVVPMHAMTAYRGSGSTAPLILNLAIDAGELSASRPGRLTLAKATMVRTEKSGTNHDVLKARRKFAPAGIRTDILITSINK